MGPMSSENALNNISDQVYRALSHGDELVTGGTVVDETFYLPTVLKVKDTESPAWREELFGPVFSVISYKHEEQALELANDTDLGLSAVVVGKNTKKAEEFGSKIDSGMVYVNELNLANCELPFGGVKRSGYGRECGSMGFESFCNVQSHYTSNK